MNGFKKFINLKNNEIGFKILYKDTADTPTLELVLSYPDKDIWEDNISDFSNGRIYYKKIYLHRDTWAEIKSYPVLKVIEDFNNAIIEFENTDNWQGYKNEVNIYLIKKANEIIKNIEQTLKIMATSKIILATRTDKNSYEKCLKDIECRFTNNQFIEKIFIICDQNITNTKNSKIETIFDLNPTRATAFNLVIDELNKNKDNKFHLLTFSKEVEFQDKDIIEMIEAINANDNLIVVGYPLKDNILSDDEIKLYSNGDLQNENAGIAYQIPWSTCALWNKKFVYGKGSLKLNFDEICEKNKNQFGKLKIKTNGKLLTTDYEGMEDGLAIAELITNNPNNDLKYKLIEKKLYWNITGDKDRIIKHKLKMARKNIVLSTFMNIKGYSIDKLIEAGKDNK